MNIFVKFYLLILTIVFHSIINVSSMQNRSSTVPLLLLISLDGFRWDYPDIYNLSNFNLLQQRGVRAQYIKNNFATVTFPLHYTLATGLYEETHGIVANTMYDPVLKAVATMETMNHSQWWSQNSHAQPIWISNQLANDSNQRRSGVIAWPGGDVRINGHIPFKYQSFDMTRTLNSMFKQVLAWFHEPDEKERINFGVIYYHEPDHTGHYYGPKSDEMKKTLQQCNDGIGQFLQMIDDDQYLKTNLNVIITSDHGMEEIKQNHTIILENYIDMSLCSAYGSRAFVNIFVHSESNIDCIYANLSTIPNYEVYKKTEIPDEYHYKSNIRIGDILFIGKVGYEIIVPGDNISLELRGDHGYDHRIGSMHPIFYGFGPAFRRNMFANAFNTVDIYPLMSYILQLEARKTNGSLNNVKHILRDFPEKTLLNQINDFIIQTKGKVTSSILITILCIILVISVAIIYSAFAYRNSKQLIYSRSESAPVRYSLLSNNAGSKNNLFGSESEDEIR